MGTAEEIKAETSAEAFNALFAASIPLVDKMQATVETVSEERVVVRLPIEGNGNDKGTLFAGAAYSALVIAGWTLVMAKAKASGFHAPWAAIVDATCHYKKAIRTDVLATATFAEEPRLVPGARNWPKVRVTLGNEEAVVFEGTYACGERHA